ncbi:MAG: ECF-type sigma factor [Planctomycetaceae bacterium]
MSEFLQQSSVTDWIDAEVHGLDASRKLWERYIDQVITACDSRLKGNLRRTLTAEDLAQEVFQDFFLGLRSRSFARLRNRDDLIKLLSILVERITVDHQRRHHALKRGGGRVAVFTDLSTATTEKLEKEVLQWGLSDVGPTDETGLRQLLLSLSPELTDPTLQDLVCDRIMGHTLEEIAERNQLSQRSVIRKLGNFFEKLRRRDQQPR